VNLVRDVDAALRGDRFLQDEGVDPDVILAADGSARVLHVDAGRGGRGGGENGDRGDDREEPLRRFHD
jgi:hypothetical protein